MARLCRDRLLLDMDLRATDSVGAGDCSRATLSETLRLPGGGVLRGEEQVLLIAAPASAADARS